MSASAAVVYPSALKLGAEALEADLEDVFITDLDSDLTSGSGKPEGSNKASSLVAASISEEWRRLQSCTAAAQNCGNSQQTVEQASSVVKSQPKANQRVPEDVFLQPSQVEEMLGQNSLLLGVPVGDGEGGKGVFFSGTDSTSSTGTLQCDPTKFPMTPSPAAPARAHRPSLWDGFISCINPLVGTFKKDKRPSEKKNEWEIPFADIRELNFIGSGSQGAVFVGEYLREKVAVKKVKDVSYCQEARHLRKLRHPHVVKVK